MRCVRPTVHMYKCIDNKWKKTSRKKEYRESCLESRKSTNKSEGAALVHWRYGSCWAQRRHHNMVCLPLEG